MTGVDIPETIGASVQQNIDTLTKVWLDEGRSLPILYPMTRDEMLAFAAHAGIGPLDFLAAFREIVERQYRKTLMEWNPDVASG